MRKDVIDGTKKLKGSVSDDDIKRHTKEVSTVEHGVVSHLTHNLCCIQIETILDKSLDKVTQMLKAKEKELSA